jgi:hypothetical protein
MEKVEKYQMTCEEYQLISLRPGSEPYDAALQQAAEEHLRHCYQCAAFQRSWLDLRTDLHAIGAEHASAQTPARVEMRLRQEFRSKHQTWKTRRNALVAAWGLAAAAIIAGTIGWVNWRHEKNLQAAHNITPSTQSGKPIQKSSAAVTPAGPELGELLVASNSSDEFTLLPGTMPGFLGDGTVVHVQMQRSALGALGLTVNEEHAGDWIQVDLLVGDDGQPQAVRLPESTD